jgi:hypothetical protein
VINCSDSCLCSLNVLFNSAGACSDRTDDGSVENDGDSTAEDNDLCRVASLNAEERLSRLRERSDVVLSKILAVVALSMARSTLPMRAPSWRTTGTK